MQTSQYRKFTGQWKKILIFLGLVFALLSATWIFLAAFSPAVEKDDGTIKSFRVWQESGTVLAAAGRGEFLVYLVKNSDEREEACGQFDLYLVKPATPERASTGTLYSAEITVTVNNIPEPDISMEEADICMSLTPDGSGLWLSLTNKEGKNQTVFFDLENERSQVFSFPDRTITGNITVSSLMENRLFYPAAGKDGKILANVDRKTLDLPIELFAMDTDSTSATAGFLPWLQVLPGDREFLFLTPPKENGAFQMWNHNVAENNRDLLLSLEGFSVPPALSARGDLLAIATAGTERPQLLLYALPNDEKIELTLDRTPATLLFWDSTTEGVYFLASENGKTGLYYTCLQEHVRSLTGDEQMVQGNGEEQVQVAEVNTHGPAEESDENHKEGGDSDREDSDIEDLGIEDRFDLVIRNGTIIDPETETVKFNYNVGIKGDRITAITREAIHGAEEIDATGLLVTPGFIDILSYSPNDVGNRFKVADGVTTNLAMHGATIDFPGWFKYYDRRTMILNYGGAVLQVGFRHKLGISNYSAPTPGQIEEMKKMTEQAILDGAIGISFSPEYYPGMSTEEIKAVMEVGKKYDLVSFFHVRYATMYGPGGNNIDAINEVIDYARELDASVQIVHINSTGGTFSMAESLKIIEDARREGVDIMVDLYPYNSWATYSNSARFDPGWQERFQISYEDLQVGNSTERLTEESFAKYRKKRVLLIAYAIPDEDVDLALQADYAMIGSDTIIEPHMNNHPRGAGCFARTIGLYARERRVIPLMKALQMMTILPARRLDNVAPALQKKGRLRREMDADITIFDYAEIIDTASAEKTGSYSQGIYYVIVNGAVVKDPHGFRSGVGPGKPIRSYFTPR